MKQTAVEWLVNEILMPEYGNIPEWVIDKVNEAKAMEKEQIETAFSKGEFFATDYFDADKPNEECSKNYYNQTFKLK